MVHAQVAQPTTDGLRILVVDHQELLRAGLRSVFASKAHVLVVEAGTALEAVRIYKEQRPDVVVLDLALPDMDGLQLVAALREHHPGCRIVVLTDAPLEEIAAAAQAAGVNGIASKQESANTIMNAIYKVARGERSFSAPPPPLRAPSRARTDAIRDLSPRERAVFQLVVTGLSNEMMAARLGISVKTIETHRARINLKLNVHSTAELIRFAARNRLLSS